MGEKISSFQVLRNVTVQPSLLLRFSEVSFATLPMIHFLLVNKRLHTVFIFTHTHTHTISQSQILTFPHPL